MVCLIKPQFEAGRDKVGKKGVVRDPQVHMDVIRSVLETAVSDGFTVLGLSWSPIRGPEGNIEYLLHLRRNRDEDADAAGQAAGRDVPDLPTEEEIRDLVNQSHQEL